MRFLLDENFPLRLLRELKDRGIDCDHIIPLGLRGISDSELIRRVEADAELVLLTQDADFEHVRPAGGRVIISRVHQGLPVQSRVDLWVRALERLVANPSRGASILEITPTGELRALRN